MPNEGNLSAGESTVVSAGERIPKKLRLWPGVVIVVLQWLIRFVLPEVDLMLIPVAVFGGILGGLAVIVWWAFFSRAPKSDRWIGVGLLIAVPVVTSFFIHESIATALVGMMFAIYATPVLSLVFVAWAAVSRFLSDRPRRVTMVAAIVLASGFWILLRTDGMTGDVRHDFAWRWAETAEERFLAQAENEPLVLPLDSAIVETVVDSQVVSKPVQEDVTPVVRIAAAWFGFRGPNRDGMVHGLQIATDWSAFPPVELWRRPIGPGCSSFAARGNLLYTQEQRGEYEVVACYNLNTGEPVWRHRDSTRFWDSHAGAGPRSTPTLRQGRVFTLGATGIMNVLDAGNGSVVWSRNAATDTDCEVPGWGFTGSPLVVDTTVVVAVSGKLVGYDVATGAVRWLGPDAGHSYSSPQLVTVDGVAQVLLLGGAGATSVNPGDGTVLWKYAWPEGSRIVQPALTADGDLLVSGGEAMAMRRIAVRHGSGGWTVEERWTSNGLKPYFNDFVVHAGHAFGFDGRMLACIDLVDGERKWKGGRYGHGQLVFLTGQNLMLVLSEQGDLALVEAGLDGFEELGRFPAIEGKTWSHPVLVGDVVLVRNGREMAAFRLSVAGG